MNRVIVEEYNPLWATQFNELKANLWPRLHDLASAIEHVGSTSVPGLAAKPFLDIDVVISDRSMLPALIERLTKLGYEHRGDLGIVGREAFAVPPNASIAHKLYVCLAGCLSLRNHLALRDRLRRDSTARDQYAQIKRDLAKRFADDIDMYVEGKSAFILSILQQDGVAATELESVRVANLAPKK